MPPDRPAGPLRELSVDLYRVSAVVLVVVGHWLAASVAYRDGRYVRDNPLTELPWTQWFTWVFQTVPVLFLAAGYAGAASRARHSGVPYRDWLGNRLRTVLGPTAAYVLVVLGLVAVAVGIRVDGPALELSGWAVAMHLWFIPVYLFVVTLTPAAVALHRRWGLFAPLAVCIAVAAVDALSVSGWFPSLGWANNLLCWTALFQIGVAWYFGAIRSARAVVLAVAGVAIAAVALTVGPYPPALIGVPGQLVQNSAPPSIVMLAVGFMQAGVLIAIAPAVTRWLRGSALRPRLAAANARIMSIYIWHMIAVVVVSLVAYPNGWFPAPAMGTAAWWLSRVLWVAALAVVTAIVLSIVASTRSPFVRGLPTVSVRFRVGRLPTLLIGGAAAASIALWEFSLVGFAPAGRFPIVTSALFAAGIALASLMPVGTRRSVQPHSDPRPLVEDFCPYPADTADPKLH